MVNWGIIGLGNIAERFAKSLEFEKDGKLAAVASISGKNTRYYKERYSGVKIYNSYEELMKDKDIDAVYIALPHGMHLKYTIRALNLKKAVLCEKPAALNSAELDRIIKCAKRNKTFYMEAVKTPFVPMIPVIKNVLDNKVIGDITEIYACFSNSAEISENKYLYDKEQGGAILDIATYPISFVLQMVDNEKILNINSNVKKEIINNVEIDTHFTSVITFENNIQAHIEGGIDINKERTAIIRGTLGTMYIKVFNRPENYIIELNDGRTYEENIKIINDDMYGEIHEVHKCLRKGETQSSLQSFELSKNILNIIDDIKNN